MFKAIGNFFTALATLFTAMNRGASALDHCAKWVEREAADFEERTQLERSARLEQLQVELKALPRLQA
ncbi:MAG: hypothetical protein CME40_11095 [Haliea sp.]|nr:hypothetical protein [Haliea sp.]|tara:strand:- start:46615 stop:46818 length:204 start_codon:yes stop_codon:yes gene_type:complete